MIVLAWLLVAIWGLALLAAGRPVLRRLPSATEAVPDYVLWLPDGGEAPALDPPPSRIWAVAEAPKTELEWVLLLRDGVSVPADLPGRLAHDGADFVGVFPIPSGGPLAVAVERSRRDFAAPQAVTDVRSATAFADGRIGWFRAETLHTLPALGFDPLLRIARARKAHGLAVDLRDGRARDGAVLCRGPGLSLAEHRTTFADLVDGDRLIGWLVIFVALLLCLLPFVCLPFAFEPALLALGLTAATRFVAATRDGFGYLHCVLGFVTEPMVALAGLTATKTRPGADRFPTPPSGRPPALTAGETPKTGGFLDRAALPFLARRLGGSAVVMEWIYANAPAGRGAIGAFIDRIALASPSSRAVRYRRLAVVELARGQEGTLLSVPCGGAGDSARIQASARTLVDPDKSARRLARLNCPDATVADGTVEACPIGPFDLVLYIGLSEYLTDELAHRQLESLRGRLSESGRLITSTTLAHPDQARMAKWLGWHTRSRTLNALTALLDRAGYDVIATRQDPLGVQAVVLAAPRPTA